MSGTADSPAAVSYISTLPEHECFELLAVAIVGRVGFVSPSGLQIIPMNYRLGPNHQLFMKTAPGSALAQLAEVDAPVAFEVDYHADDFQIAWSVLMNGTISRLDAAARRRTSSSVGLPFRGLDQPALFLCGSSPERYPGAVYIALTQTDERIRCNRLHLRTIRWR